MKSNNTFISSPRHQIVKRTTHCEYGCNVSIPCGATSCPRCGGSVYTFDHNGGGSAAVERETDIFKNVPEVDLFRGITPAQKRRSEKEAQLEMARMKKLHDKLLSLYRDGVDCDTDCGACPYDGMPYCGDHRAIDHMISHGVIIDQKKQMYGTLRPKKGNRRYLCLLEDEVRL